MHLGYVIVYVQDVSKTVEFYESAFGLVRRFVHESGTYAEMETGGTSLAFACESVLSESVAIRPNRFEEVPAAIEIALVCEQVDAAFRKALQAGAKSVLPPESKPWGQVVSYVRDLNGVLVEICSPVSA